MKKLSSSQIILLATIKKCWKLYPDKRFGELLIMAQEYCHIKNLKYSEDGVIRGCLEILIKRGQ